MKPRRPRGARKEDSLLPLGMHSSSGREKVTCEKGPPAYTPKKYGDAPSQGSVTPAPA